MAQPLQYRAPSGNAEIRDYAGIMAQAFAGPPVAFAEWAARFGPDNVRVMHGAGVESGLVIYRMGQYFGGRSVPIWGIAGVAVPPEHRGRGLAREMMLANLREQHDSGPPVSALYPATTQLYRSLGWETAGARTTYQVMLADLPGNKVDASIRKAMDDDAELIRTLYAQRYAQANGCLDRNDEIWKRVYRAPEGSPVFSYVVECDGRAEGYAIYLQKRKSDASYVFNLQARDVVALTPRALDKLFSFFASHRSVAESLQFFGAPNDPFLARALKSQVVDVRNRLDWMLRVVRVKDALEARGYSSAIRGELRLNVSDEHLPENQRDWTIAVQDGQAQAQPGGKSNTTIDIRGLSAMYTGRMSPTELRQLGLLEGDDDQDEMLATTFAGPPPWMPDFF